VVNERGVLSSNSDSNLFHEVSGRCFFRPAGTVSFLTLLSRLLGYARDVVVAHFFGASMAADAFYAAAAIPNLVRKLYAEGSLTDSFIPVYSGMLAEGKHGEALDIAHKAFSVLVILLLGISALGSALAPLIARAIAPGFMAHTEQYILTTDMLRIMLPYIFFIGLVALARGILHSFQRFTAPALAPALLNICLILAAFLMAPHLQRPVIALAMGMLVGGVAQFALQVPSLWYVGIRIRFRLSLGNSALRRIAKGLIPTLLASSICQINTVVGFLLASMLTDGSISCLYYADRLVQMPIGFIAMPLAIVAFPFMAHQVRGEAATGIGETLEQSLRFMFFLIFPALTGLIILRIPIFSLLFQRGAFGHRETLLCADALLNYSWGLWAFAGLQILPRALYAAGDLWSPFKSGILALGANLVLSLVLMSPMGHGGLALANSLAAVLYFSALLGPVVRKLHQPLIKKCARSMTRFLMASILMGIFVSRIASLGHWEQGLNTNNFLVLAGAMVAGLAGYLMMAIVARFPEIKELGIQVGR